MADVHFRLPKLHVYFKTNKSPEEVKTEVLGPLANDYESLIQTLLNNAGQTGLVAEMIRGIGKVMRDGDRWGVYLKCSITGETSLTEQQIKQAWENKKADIKSAAKARLEGASFGATEVRFSFKRLDKQEAVEEA